MMDPIGMTPEQRRTAERIIRDAFKNLPPHTQEGDAAEEEDGVDPA